jgi:hypothetical protein
MGTGVLSPGVKRGRGVTLTTHPYLEPRLRMSRSYTSSPPKCLYRCVAGLQTKYLKENIKQSAAEMKDRPPPQTIGILEYYYI